MRHMLDKSYIKVFKYLTAAILCIALLSCSVISGFAADIGSISLTLLDRETDMPVSDVSFRLYKFASAKKINGKYVYTYDEGYSTCGMDMGDFSDAYLPVHLTAYVQLNELSYIEHTTDASGSIAFESLSLGAYLVMPVGEKEGYITPSPFIITVPMWDSAKEEWCFDIDASPKTEAETQEGEKTYISVKKQWQGNNGHPKEVKVSLLKDSVIYDTVTLSAENNWYYKWDGLDKSHSWSVAEISVPQRYVVSYSASQMTVTMLNSKLEYDTPTDKPSVEIEGTESSPKPDQLIQTGQLNWPVPILSVSGLVLFALGWALSNLGKNTEGGR